jgi:hypothetical protein
MQDLTIKSLVPVIQAAISPAILMSAFGLLILSMSNRLGRVIDRARKLIELKKAGEPKADVQIAIIWRRARLLRMCITLSALGTLSAALNIILIFLSVIFGVGMGIPVVSLFILGMSAVIAALLIYIVEINQSLKAIETELQG